MSAQFGRSKTNPGPCEYQPSCISPKDLQLVSPQLLQPSCLQASHPLLCGTLTVRSESPASQHPVPWLSSLPWTCGQASSKLAAHGPLSSCRRSILLQQRGRLKFSELVESAYTPSPCQVTVFAVARHPDLQHSAFGFPSKRLLEDLSCQPLGGLFSSMVVSQLQNTALSSHFGHGRYICFAKSPVALDWAQSSVFLNKPNCAGRLCSTYGRSDQYSDRLDFC